MLNSLVTEKEFIREIVVVEQEVNNKQIIATIAKQKDLKLKYIYLSEASTSHAKNVGANVATGKYLLFLDDDVVAMPNLVQNHELSYADDNVAAVCGRSIAYGQNIQHTNDKVGRISKLAIFSDGYSSTVKQEIDTVIGCNASWRRTLFEEIGGFDEKFTGNAMREESDLSLRAKAKGYKIIFEPKALVYHLREPHGGARKVDNRLFWYFHFFSNETYFFLKNRNLFLFPFFVITRVNWILRCMFGFGREVSINSLVTPFRGVFDGILKYLKHLYENRS